MLEIKSFLASILLFLIEFICEEYTTKAMTNKITTGIIAFRGSFFGFSRLSISRSLIRLLNSVADSSVRSMSFCPQAAQKVSLLELFLLQFLQ
jgi:hypothetical protein